MDNIQSNRFRPKGMAFCGLLLCAAALTAVANTNYDSDSLSGNIHEQCTDFTVAKTTTDITVSAECNKEGETAGSVASTRNETSFGLAADVVWVANEETMDFQWDATVTDENNIANVCELTMTPFIYSSTKVTLRMLCDVNDLTTIADLDLTELEANKSGELVRA